MLAGLLPRRLVGLFLRGPSLVLLTLLLLLGMIRRLLLVRVSIGLRLRRRGMLLLRRLILMVPGV
jgi:hypothetical protein